MESSEFFLSASLYIGAELEIFLSFTDTSSGMGRPEIFKLGVDPGFGKDMEHVKTRERMDMDISRCENEIDHNVLF